MFTAPLALLAVTAVFVFTVAATRYISLGSIVGALTFPALYWFIYHPDPVLLAASIFAGVLIIYRHRGNIERLRSGNENVFSLKGGSAH